MVYINEVNRARGWRQAAGVKPRWQSTPTPHHQISELRTTTHQSHHHRAKQNNQNALLGTNSRLARVRPSYQSDNSNSIADVVHQCDRAAAAGHRGRPVLLHLQGPLQFVQGGASELD
jgi:hypothetical protein